MNHTAVKCMLLVLAGVPAWAGSAPIYEETFDSDAGTFTLDNPVPGEGWAFDDDCPPAVGAPGGAGVLRWGEYNHCFGHGVLGNLSTASTPVFTTYTLSNPCKLKFSYYLELERPGDFDHADVEVTVDGSTQPLLSVDNGTLMNAATWLTAEQELPDGETIVHFVGLSEDGSFNTGNGWSIDDVSIECDVVCTGCGVPATSTWSLIVLIAGLGLAMAWSLNGRRRALTRPRP